MKNVLRISCLFASLLTTFSSYADDSAIANGAHSIVQWSSSNTDDKITIQNGNGAKLSIQITVSGDDTSPGINIQNCGNTTSLQPGSSAVCVTNDPSNPVSFSSDDQSMAASGTYQITQAP